MLFELEQLPLYKSIHMSEFKNTKTEAELIKQAAELLHKCPPADLLLAVWRHCCLLNLPPVSQQRIIIFMDGLINEA
jgi:hypothetical protein